MRKLLLAAFAVLATLASPGWARADDGLPPVERYFSRSELRRSHPGGQPSRVYHGVQHTLDTRQFEYDLARSRGLPHEKARFLSEVALLHDWDPGRAPGTPARVEATLAVLDADFAGREPLLAGYRGRSVLRERFGWSARDVAVARALIQRTTFPFDEAATRGYERALGTLSRVDQRFVLREGALLSEYADKASTYSMRDLVAVRKATRGLAREINTAAGRRVMTAAKLDPGAFIATIGARESFAPDHAIARKLGLRVSFPSRERAFARMPASYAARLRATIAGHSPTPTAAGRRAPRPRVDAARSRSLQQRAATRASRGRAAARRARVR